MLLACAVPVLPVGGSCFGFGAGAGCSAFFSNSCFFNSITLTLTVLEVLTLRLKLADKFPCQRGEAVMNHQSKMSSCPEVLLGS